MSNETPALREFLYVDVDRARSLLAQLQGGVVEEVKSHGGHAFEGEAGLNLFGFRGSGGYSREGGVEEARSLQDLIFVAFEETAEEQNVIRDLGQTFFDPSEWESGTVHAELEAGEVIRITCDVQMLDGMLFRERLSRLDTMASAVSKLSSEGNQQSPQRSKSQGGKKGGQGQQQPQKQQQRQADEAKKMLMGGIDPKELEAMADFIDSFLGDSISIRVLPCGADHLDYGFSGALLGREEYIQQEREHLFSRYGTQASRWTSVLQVAALPTREAVQEPQTGDPRTAAGMISRATMESMAVDLLSFMEGLGIMEGPRWPSVNVTPLGIYRDVPAGA